MQVSQAHFLNSGAFPEPRRVRFHQEGCDAADHAPVWMGLRIDKHHISDRGVRAKHFTAAYEVTIAINDCSSRHR